MGMGWRFEGGQRPLRGLFAALLALGSLAAAAPARATFGDCVLSIAENSPVVGQPGASVPFTIVATAGTGSGICGQADISIDLVDDTTFGSSLSTNPTSVSFGSPAQAVIALPPLPHGGGAVTYEVTCEGGCDETAFPKPQFTVEVANVYDLQFQDPKDGTAFTSGGQPVALSAQVLSNGDPGGIAEPPVCFSIVGPSQGATLDAGCVAPDPSTGIATVTLNPNGPLCSQVAVSATAAFPDGPQSVQFTVIGEDGIALAVVGGDNQVAVVNSPFAERLAVRVSCGGAPVVAETVDWQLDFAPQGTVFDGAPSSATGSDGIADIGLIAGPVAGPVFVRAALPATGFDVNVTFESLRISRVYEIVHVSPATVAAVVFDEVPLQVRLRVDGGPAANEEVEYALVSGPSPGNLGKPQFILTNGAGEATLQFVPDALGTYVVRATFDLPPEARGSVGVPPVSIDFTINVGDGGVITVFDAGSPGYPGSQRFLSVQVSAGGDAIPGDPIDFAVSGPATLSTLSADTNSDGLATVTLTYGPGTGAVTVSATRALDPTQSVTFTGLESYAFTLAPVGPAAVSGNPGVAVPLAVLLERAGVTTVAAAGQPIDWTVVSGPGPGTISGGGPTDGSGVSAIEVVFAQLGSYQVQAQFTDPAPPAGDPPLQRSQLFTVQIAEVVTTLDVVSGNGQSAQPGQSLPQPLVVVAANDGQPPQSAVTIDWTVAPVGAATIDSSPSATDAQGQSSVLVALAASATPGQPITITATRADSGDQAVFTVNVLAPVARTLVKPNTDSGDGQSGSLGTTLPQPLRALALDDGAAAAGITVNWSVTGDAQLGASQSVTDADGFATVTVTLGNTPQSITIVASRQDEPAASTSYVVTAVAGAGDALMIVDGNGQLGLLEQPARPLRVLYTFDGVPEPGIPVSWTVVSGSATLSATSGPTAADGTAQVGLTFGATPGPVVVRARAGTATVDFLLEAVAGVLVIESGDGQSAPPGSALPADLVVRVDGPAGQASSLAGVPVVWEIVSGESTLASPTVATDAAGRAANRLTLGSVPGTSIVRASIAGGSAVEFTATAVAAGTTLAIVGGNNQSGPAQTPGALPLEVELRNSDGAAVPGSTILWQVLGGGVEVDQASSVTDAEGRARTGFRFGPAPGPAQVRASSPLSGTSVDFTLVTTAALQIAILSGDGQSGTPGQPLAEDLVVTIAPAGGSAPAGVTVFWEVVEGGGSLATATSQTDASGHARNRLTLGPAAGPNRVSASLPGGGSVVFTAQALAASGQLRIVSGNSQVLPTNHPSDPLVVEVLDASGAPVPGVRLRWTVVGAGQATPSGSVESEFTTTNAQGRSSNIARVLVPGALRVLVDFDRPGAQSPLAFDLNGGIANIPNLSEPQRRVGGALDAACPALAALPSRNAEQEDLFRRCLELSGNAGSNPNEVREALDAIPTPLGDALVDAGFAIMGTQFDNHARRFEALRKGRAADRNQFDLALWTPTGTLPLSFLPSAIVDGGGGSEEAGAGFERWGFFATGTIGRGKSRGNDHAPGFDFDTGGITAGVDYRFSDRLVGGASLGYARYDSELRGGAGALDTRGWTVSGYASWFNERNWYIDGVLSYGSNDYTLDRRLAYSITALGGGRTSVDQRARGDTDGTMLGGALSLGRDIQRGPWTLSSYLRGNFTRVELDGYEERMLAGTGSGLGLAFDGRTLNSLTSALGGKATYILSRDWGVLMPHAQLEWEHEFRDDPARLVARFVHDPTGTRFEQSGTDIDRNVFNVGVGVSALFPGGRAVYVYYEQLMGASRLSQGTLSLGARFEF
jgi:outer membrane autotransporter protein